MQNEFEMSMMGELTFFLGLQVKQNKDGIFINQTKYIKDMLKKFEIPEVKEMPTPMSPATKLDKDEKGKDVCHNGFPLDLELENTNNGVATNLFFLFWCDWSPIKGLWSLKTKFGFGSTITCREGISTPTTPEKSVPSN